MSIDSINPASRATSRGTPIVQPDQGMDKNAFLRILTTELSNQDPDNAKDSTEYVSQMAQFTSLEQISNLNKSMTLNSAAALIGKTVKLNQYDPQGNQYEGVVRGTLKDGGDIKLHVEVAGQNGTEIKDFSFDDVSEVSDQ